MCCSIRAAVFFLASLHIYFSITQMVTDLPLAFSFSSFGDRAAASILAVLYTIFFFSSGFMTFRGADEESTVLIGGGAVVLFFMLAERFTLMYWGMLLKPTLPEGDFLIPYGKTVPVIFVVLLYLVYLSILFCYHNELQHIDSQERSMSPLNFQSPRHIRPTTVAGTPSGLVP